MKLYLCIAVCISLFCYFTYQLFFNSVPIVPSPITVSINENNKSKELILPNETPRIELYDQTFASIDPQALCKPYYRGILDRTPEFKFRCVWYDKSETPNRYVAAEVQLIVPIGNGVKDWEFERTSLTLKPIMEYWPNYNYNSFKLLGLLLSVLGATGSYVSLTNTKPKHSHA